MPRSMWSIIHFICLMCCFKEFVSQPLHNLITSRFCFCFVSVDDYFLCVENGRAATASLSAFFRKNFQQSQGASSKAG